METLPCTKCAAVLPVDQFDRSTAHPKRGNRHPWCKSCRKASAAARYEANRDSIRQRVADDRKVSPERYRKWSANYRRKHPDKVRAGIARWQKANGHKQTEYHRRWRKKDPARTKRIEAAIEKRRRPQKRAQLAKWRDANREHWRALTTAARSKRRAKAKASAVGTDRAAYVAFIKRLRSAESVPCYWCGKATRKGKRHVDHIIPIVKHGADDVHNLCCSCGPCNLSKKDKLPEVFSGQFELVFTGSARRDPSACRD